MNISFDGERGFRHQIQHALSIDAFPSKPPSTRMVEVPSFSLSLFVQLP